MARACRLALDAEWAGHEAFFISNLDSRLRTTTTAAAIAQYYPEATMKRDLGEYESAISVAKAERFFGWVPVEQWRSGGAEGLKGPQLLLGPAETAPVEKVWARRQRVGAARL